METSLPRKLVNWIRKEVKSTKAKGVILGISGGIDSAVTASLCKSAFPKNVLGLIMPCFSSRQDINDAKLIAKRFSIKTKTIDLCPVFQNLYKNLEGRPYKEGKINMAIANIKPRLRMLTLYYFANKLNYLVVGSGNKSELMMGYFTKYGDGGVDILPLGGLLKSEIRELGKILGIPEKIIKKVPTAGLWPGQTDEGEMGITYDEIDKVLSKNFSQISKKAIKKVKERIALTEHKRKPPKIYEV